MTMFTFKMPDLLRRSRRLHLAVALVAAQLLAGAPLALADDPLCMNDLAQAPLLDGDIRNDDGWTRANQYEFGNGTPIPDAVVQMGRHGDNLYFSFEVYHDDEWHSEDKIVLLLGPAINDPTKDMRIHIHPVTALNTPLNGSYVPKLWLNSNTWSTTGRETSPDATPAGLTAQVRTVNGPGDGTSPAGKKDNSYFVEVKVPVASLASTGKIKLHFNVLRLYTVTSASGAILHKMQGQLNWPIDAKLKEIPPNSPANPSAEALMTEPARITWGEAVTTACNGVRVKKVWLNNESNAGSGGTLNSPPVGGSATNSYYVRLENSGTANAQGILASIKSNRFGIANLTAFGQVPAVPNPLGPSGMINGVSAASNNIADLGPATWTISRAEWETKYQSNRTVCSFVTLDVDPNLPVGTRVNIANRYYIWNTSFAPASVLQNSAVLDSSGFAPPADGSGIQQFDLKTFVKEIPGITAGTDGLFPAARAEGSEKRLLDSVGQNALQRLNAVSLYRAGASFYGNTVCAYRRTGRYISMGGVSVEVAERTPCFANWAFHKEKMEKWIGSMVAQCPQGTSHDPNCRIERDPATGDQAISVSVGQALDLMTRIEAVESKLPCACGDWKCQVGSIFTESGSSGLLAGTVALFGTLGVGGLAFRRRGSDVGRPVPADIASE